MIGSDHSLRNITEIRVKLLHFYDLHKRDLEWRKPVKDLQQRAYRVWVSEIMLQQTRVETVKEYYQNWMNKWPTVKDFVQADLEQVHALWSGLGYYSRATRLLEGAKQVMNERKGIIPTTPKDLQTIPGIGPYTAGAISSIAFENTVPLVDGNVIRVLSRMTALPGDPKTKHMTDKIWELAAKVVDPQRPGCFNQSLMELGATVCTPTNPSCSTCPVRENCSAYILQETSRKRKADDIEDLKFDGAVGTPIKVTDFPTKVPKKEARKEAVIVCIFQFENWYLLAQNPAKGLLANLWDFPNVILEEELDKNQLIKDRFGETLKTVNLGTIVHKFSHIHRTMVVELIKVPSKESVDLCSLEGRPTRWVAKEQFLDTSMGLPITHTKAWQLYQKQTKLIAKKNDFFKPKTKKQ
jgi:A/G-specific adenine glycosylase